MERNEEGWDYSRLKMRVTEHKARPSQATEPDLQLKGWQESVDKQIEEYRANRDRAREAMLLGQILQ